MDELHQRCPDSGAPPFAYYNVSEALRVCRDNGVAKLREEGVCRLCLRRHGVLPGFRLTRHHLVPKSHFTSGILGYTPIWVVKVRDADANIVPLCRGCHDEVEQTEAGRVRLRARMSQAEVAYCIQVRGQAWLERRYPARRAKVSPGAKRGLLHLGGCDPVGGCVAACPVRI